MPTISGTVLDNTGALAAGRVVRAYRRDTGALLGSAVTGDGSLTVGDPDFGSVSLLLHMDGSNGSTEFVDSSTPPKTTTAFGDAQISTGQSRFGGASGVFDGNGDYLSTDTSAAFGMGAGDFCVEFFIRFNDTSNRFPFMFDFSGSSSGWLYLERLTGGNLMVYAGGNTTASSAAAAIGNWYHIAITRSSNFLRFFINGTAVYSGTFSGDMGASRKVFVGGDPISVGSTGLHNGNIDELRITKGVARYTANFTPPTVPFPGGGVVLPLGQYSIDTGTFAGECNVVCLDDSGGTTYNDLILRTTPV